MRKEVIIAIVLGFALGLAITFGIWNANKALKENEAGSVTEETIPTPQSTPTAVPALSLAILSPEDESVQGKEKITLSGTTEPGASVTIISEKGESVVEADQSGRFETDVLLDSGTNEITVTAANDAGDEATKIIYVVFEAEG